MNKSMFLKKSLAMLLAVMLVFASIPLGAAAAEATPVKSIWVNQNGLTEITIKQGTLTANEALTVFTDSLTYDVTGEEEVKIEMNPTNYDRVSYKVDGGEAATEEANSSSIATIKFAVSAQQVVFTLTNADGSKTSDEFTINVDKPAASNQTSLKSAKLAFEVTVEGSAVSKEVEGTVNNDSRTISVVFPWGVEEGTVTAEMNYPTSTPISHDIKLGSDGTASKVITVTAQNGSSTTYTINATSLECLTEVKVDGVAAEVDESDPTLFLVTLPEGAVLEDHELEVGLTVGKAYTAKLITPPATVSGDPVVEDIKSGDKHLFEELTPYGLVIFDGDDEDIYMEYTLVVRIAPSSDASIGGLLAAAADAGHAAYLVEGRVSGDQVFIQLPYGCDPSAVMMRFDVAEGASITIGGTAFDNDDPDPVDLTSPVRVTVTAPDGVTTKLYRLSATVDEEPVGNPTIKGATLYIGDDAYEASVSSTTITFTVPYSTKAADILGGEIEFEVSYGAQMLSIDDINDGSFTDPFTGTNKIRVVSNNGERAQYTVVFAKDAAKTEKALTNFKLTAAEDEDSMDEENTFPVDISGETATVVLPYSLSATDLIPSFEISEGAKLFLVASNKVDAAAPLKSGFTDEDGSATALSVSALDGMQLVVADEKAVVDMNEAKVSLDDLKADPYTGHVTILTVAASRAAAQIRADLTAFSGAKGVITSVVSSATVAITAPASYVDNENKRFFADYTATKYATVKAGSVVIPAKYDDETTVGKMQIVTSGSGYAIEVFNGRSFESFNTISVISEDGNTTNIFSVTVSVNAPETEALLLSAKINGIDAVVDQTAKTVVATLPRNTDLTKLTVSYEISPMATAHELSSVTTTDADGNVTYDLTNPLRIRIESEMGDNARVYTMSVKTRSDFSDVKAGVWYYSYVMSASDKHIVDGNPDGTFKPLTNITREQFAKMVGEMMVVSGRAAREDLNVNKTYFSDNDKMSDYAKPYIAYLSSKGIMKGDSETTFNPKGKVTREMAATVIARVLRIDGVPTVDFRDISRASSWAVDSIRACKVEKIFQGDENSKFNPKDPITRAEAAKVLVISSEK